MAVYVVTGGTSGIGKQICEDLCKEGHKVVALFGHDEKQANGVLKQFHQKKFMFEIIKCDISNEDEVKNAFNQIKNQYKCINGLVNNAGTNIDEFVETCKLENYMKVVNTNFIGKMLCSKYAIPLLKNEENACIVNIASSLGVRPDTECSAY